MRALFSLHRPRDTIPLQFVPYFGHESERNSMSGREVNRLWSSSAMRSPMNYGIVSINQRTLSFAATNEPERITTFNARGRQNAKSQHFEFISKNVIDFYRD